MYFVVFLLSVSFCINLVVADGTGNVRAFPSTLKEGFPNLIVTKPGNRQNRLHVI